MGSKTTKQKARKNNSKARKTNEPIVVAQIMGKWVGGGVEAVIMNYYRHIDRTKVQFDFICDEDSTNIPYEEIEKLGGKVILCPPYQKLPKYLKFLKQLFKEKKYRIVHSNINTLSVFPLYAAKKAGVPVRIAHAHATTDKKEIVRNLIKQILKHFSRMNANVFMSCSETAAKFQFGKKRKDVFLIKNAIDIDKFTFDKKIRKKYRQILDVADDVLVIGNVGRLVKTKNQLFLIDLFAELLKDKKQKAKLVIVGSGPNESEIRKRIIDKKLKDKVILLGQRGDVEKWYQAFDLYVAPSLYEGFGLSILEAQASNLPCVISDAIPHDVVINEKICTFLSLSNNTREWTKAIRAIEKSDVRKSNKIAIKNAGFDIDIQANMLTDIYLGKIGDMSCRQ